ncbi:2Fe-2S iron-sulfur cluster-binding protein [Evansella sp. AB-P1]|uniref:2Fe-2S iron-sulfur cluster-binding protein n=1 Tax=Evansella sp. AB-P1 TaxID=3037653 RepID=UPI00241FFA4F|nr:2Fe-2S iron-sulfur cluster-binding protein [Evansella sp. AB-P1]MDG5788483.1 2Fe-2S iron-sulfur cluster-binding protein [Evansella sp. AB-P1]
MPKVTIPNVDSFDVEEGTKLVLALEDNGVDVLHRCGGKAKCTTCRVEVIEGNFGPLTDIEKDAFKRKGLDDSSRLSCQVRVHEDVTVLPLKTASSTGLDPGPRPEK